MREAASALQKLLRKEFDRLLDDPEKIEKLLILLYQLAQKKAVEDHNSDLCTVAGLLFKYTENQPNSDDHQYVLAMLSKYAIPYPRESTKQMRPVGRA